MKPIAWLPGAVVILVVLIVGFTTIPAGAASVDIGIGQLHFKREVQSLGELRWSKLTPQGWDISCGAAALSTLLTYHNRRPFSEMVITLSILKNSDPELVRQRGGFSLLDLKRFVAAVGLEGLGYGEMTLDDLETFGIPAILPVRIRDFDHFVVFRERVGDRVLVGDPAFGNLSFTESKFLRLWSSRIAFFVLTGEEKLQFQTQQSLAGRNRMTPRAMELAIPDSSYTGRILSRIPVVPATRRLQSLR